MRDRRLVAERSSSRITAPWWIVMLATEIEKVVDGVRRDAALLRADGGVTGEGGVHVRAPLGYGAHDAHGGGS